MEDLRHVKDLLESSSPRPPPPPDAAASTTSNCPNLDHHRQQQHRDENEEARADDPPPPLTTDSAAALTRFLDRIPITSIPDIDNSPYSVEIELNDSVRDAITLLHDRNVPGAPIVENVKSDIGGFRDREMGFIHLSTILLWSLQEIDKACPVSGSSTDSSGFFGVLEQIPHVGLTKIAALAKSFLWEPFFPISSDDTLLHILLLLAKHPKLQVVPLTSPCTRQVVGYATQNAVVQLLLQSSGLEWFDKIADKAITELRLTNNQDIVCVCGDQSLADGICSLMQNQVDTAPVIDRNNRKLIGSLGRKEVCTLLLEDNNLFNNRRKLSVEEFISICATQREEEIGKLHAFGISQPKNPIPGLAMNMESDTLKKVMESMVSSNSDCCFLLNEAREVVGIVTLKDVIMQFSPPTSDTRIEGANFFESALDQTGCHIENGMMICDR